MLLVLSHLEPFFVHRFINGIVFLDEFAQLRQ